MTTAVSGGLYQDYSYLNGIAGTYNSGSFSSLDSSLPLNSYGMCGYYGYGMNIDQAKQNLQNNYEYNSLYQSYNNMQSAQSLNLNTSCRDISNLLAQGRTDEAMKMHENLIKTMKSLPQYQECTDTQLKDMLRQQYTTSTGSDLVMDIDANASSSFWQGVKQGIPILGTFFANNNTKDDAIAQVTNYDQSKGAKAAKTAGSLLSGVGSGAAIGAVIGGGVPGAIVGGIVGGVLSLGKSIFGK